jgi:hypothetical protein
MSHSRLSVSDREIGALPFASPGQHIVRNEDVAGSFLLVGTRYKTFMIQADLGRTESEARVKAKVLLGQLPMASIRG